MTLEDTTGGEVSETAIRLLNLGSDFEKFAPLSARPVKLLKPGDISSAILGTNENADIKAILAHIGKKPDGYIYGVGAGNIFSLPVLYDDNNPPRAIFSTDILPDAVLAGRTIAVLIRSSKKFDHFTRNLSSQPTFDKAIEEVIESETSNKIRDVLKKVDRDSLFNLITMQFYSLPKSGIVHSGRVKDVISVLAAIRDGWNPIKQLADEHNIGFSLADYFDPKIIKYILSLPSFSKYNNIIYASNLIDYPTSQVSTRSNDPMWDSFKRSLRPFNTQSNIFIFSTKENDLELVATRGLEPSAPKGFWLI